MRRRLLLAAAATAAATLTAATAADANTTCVGGPGCFPTIAAAVADANAQNDADKIEVHAGTHAVPATVTAVPAGGPLEIDGAGRATTFLELTAPANQPALRLYAGSVLTDLTVNLGAGDSRFGLDVSEGTVARVDVHGPDAGQSSSGIILRDGADADKIDVQLAPSPGIASHGLSADAEGSSRLTDIKVTADYCLITLSYGGAAPTVVRGARLHGKYGALSARGSKIDADGVAADLYYPGHVVYAGSMDRDPSEVVLKHATLRGPAGATGIYVGSTAVPSTSIVSAHEVAIAGPSQHAQVYSKVGATAKLEYAWSAMNPALVSVSGAGNKQVVQGPGLVTTPNLGLPLGGNVDPVPSYASPLVDAGEPGPALLPANLLDVRGFSRVQDGDGDGTKVRDIGAVELTPPIQIGPLPQLP